MRCPKCGERIDLPYVPPMMHFQEFWNAYPRKVGRPAAIRAFKKLRVDEIMLKEMLNSLESQKKGWDDARFIPHPSTWLNQRRWEDQTEVPVDELKPVDKRRLVSDYFKKIGKHGWTQQEAQDAWEVIKSSRAV